MPQYSVPVIFQARVVRRVEASSPQQAKVVAESLGVPVEADVLSLFAIEKGIELIVEPEPPGWFHRNQKTGQARVLLVEQMGDGDDTDSVVLPPLTRVALARMIPNQENCFMLEHPETGVVLMMSRDELECETAPADFPADAVLNPGEYTTRLPGMSEELHCRNESQGWSLFFRGGDSSVRVEPILDLDMLENAQQAILLARLSGLNVDDWGFVA